MGVINRDPATAVTAAALSQPAQWIRTRQAGPDHAAPGNPAAQPHAQAEPTPANPTRTAMLLSAVVLAALTLAAANGWGAATADVCASAPEIPCGP
jgi:hypothetical protein